MNSILYALFGGLLIGLASTLMLWGLGRITGISGIYSSILTPSKEHTWKYSFLFGLLTGGAVIYLVDKNSYFNYEISGSYLRVILAGLLVGFGTRMGNGCTSGHGVCGISRGAKRSFIATVIFILTGMIIVSIEELLK